MPAYLVHGFRWPRLSIRDHIVHMNIDDAAPDYITSPQTSAALRESLRERYGQDIASLPDLQFVEQYDPDDDGKKSSNPQPFAFVADKVETVNLSLNVVTGMAQGVDPDQWGALADLKDRLAPKEQVGWWIVHNGDVLRTYDGSSVSSETSTSCAWTLLIYPSARMRRGRGAS